MIKKGRIYRVSQALLQIQITGRRAYNDAINVNAFPCCCFFVFYFGVIVRVECTKSDMLVTLTFGFPFNGRVYATGNYKVLQNLNKNNQFANKWL